MQQLQKFLQEEITLDELDLERIVEQIALHDDVNSPEYQLLELSLNHILTQYLERAKQYIIK